MYYIYMPLIKGFGATTIHKAFILNALASAMVASIAVITKDRLDRRKKLRVRDKYLGVFLITFMISLIVFYCLFLLFGFGRGMLA
jgi:hypothetical protein